MCRLNAPFWLISRQYIAPRNMICAQYTCRIPWIKQILCLYHIDSHCISNVCPLYVHCISIVFPLYSHEKLDLSYVKRASTPARFLAGFGLRTLQLGFGGLAHARHLATRGESPISWMGREVTEEQETNVLSYKLDLYIYI